MRVEMRRSTRLNNGFSKKFENHMQIVPPYTVWYNFMMVRKAVKMTPPMTSGVSPGSGLS